MASPSLSRVAAQPQYVYQASALINAGSWTGIGNPGYADWKDENFAETLRLDPISSTALEQFRSDVAGAEQRMIPGGENPDDIVAAQIVQECFLDALDIPDILDGFANAPLTGAEYGILEWGDKTDPEDEGWQYREIGDLPGKYFRIPSGIDRIHRHRIRYRSERAKSTQPKVPGKLRIFTELYSFERERWEELVDEGWLMRHVIGDDEYHMGYGSALMDSLLNIDYAEKIAYRELCTLLEIQGIRVYKMDLDRLTEPDTSNDAEATTAIRRIKDLRGRDVMAIAKDESIEILKQDSDAIKNYVDFIKHCQEIKTRRILGSLLPSGGGSDVGSNARAGVEAASTSRRTKFHRKRLARTFQLYGVQRWWVENWPTLAELGFTTKTKCPLFAIEDEPAEVDLLKEAQTDEVLSRVGLTLSVDDMRKRYKRAAPKNDLDTLKPVPAPSPFGGLGLPPGEGKPPIPGNPVKESA